MAGLDGDRERCPPPLTSPASLLQSHQAQDHLNCSPSKQWRPLQSSSMTYSPRSRSPLLVQDWGRLYTIQTLWLMTPGEDMLNPNQMIVHHRTTPLAEGKPLTQGRGWRGQHLPDPIQTKDLFTTGAGEQPPFHSQASGGIPRREEGVSGEVDPVGDLTNLTATTISGRPVRPSSTLPTGYPAHMSQRSSLHVYQQWRANGYRDDWC